MFFLETPAKQNGCMIAPVEAVDKEAHTPKQSSVIPA